MVRKSTASWVVVGAFVVAAAILALLYRPPQWPAVPDATLQSPQGEPFPLSRLSRQIWVALWTDPERNVACADVDAVLSSLDEKLPPEVRRLAFVGPAAPAACLNRDGWQVLTAPLDELRSLAGEAFDGGGASPVRFFVIDRGGRVRGEGSGEEVLDDVRFLLSLDRRPRWHAMLNGTSALLAAVGYLFIRTRRKRTHAACMILAALTTGAFLVSYLYYHYHAGTVGFQGQGWVRPLYFGILLTHTVLAAFVAPLVALVFFYALSGRFRKHRRLARCTLPLWLYVSVTGVMIYLMLYVWFPG